MVSRTHKKHDEHVKPHETHFDLHVSSCNLSESVLFITFARLHHHHHHHHHHDIPQFTATQAPTFPKINKSIQKMQGSNADVAGTWNGISAGGWNHWKASVFWHRLAEIDNDQQNFRGVELLGPCVCGDTFWTWTSFQLMRYSTLHHASQSGHVD